MTHQLTERSGTRTRLVTRGDGSGGTETLTEGPWKQCTRCGMSEGMIKLLDAECEPGEEDDA